MKTLGIVLTTLSFTLVGCDSKPKVYPSTTTSLATGMVHVQDVVDPDVSFPFMDTDDYGDKEIGVNEVLNVQEVGGGMCLVNLPGNLKRVYGILASCNLGLTKGSTAYFRFGRSIIGNIWQSYSILISEAEARSLEKVGWHIATFKRIGSALDGAARSITDKTK